MTQVVVIAGGLGTRLGAAGRQRPKILQPVAGRPFIDWMLQPLVSQGFRRFEFCLGHLADQVTTYLDNAWSHLRLCYHIDAVPAGTAGTLRNVVDHLEAEFLVLLGDTYLNIDYAELHRALDPDSLGVMAVTSQHCGVAGNVEMQPPLVTRYHKDAPQRLPWVDCGVIHLRRAALSLIDDLDGAVDLGALFQRIIATGRLRGHPVNERFYDIGTSARIDEFQEFVLKNLAAP